MKATFYVCKAMQASLSGKADGQQSSLGHCERASGHLWNSLNMNSSVSSTVLNNVRAISPGISRGLYWLSGWACCRCITSPLHLHSPSILCPMEVEGKLPFLPEGIDTFLPLLYGGAALQVQHHFPEDGLS